MNQETNPNAQPALQVEGDTLILTLSNYVVTLKIEAKHRTAAGRLKLALGQTLFDLVLEAAREFVRQFGEQEFAASDLYHIARELHPELNLRRNTWTTHVTASAPLHPSYKHHTSQRDFFRYHSRGRYTLKPEWIQGDKP